MSMIAQPLASLGIRACWCGSELARELAGELATKVAPTTAAPTTAAPTTAAPTTAAPTTAAPTMAASTMAAPASMAVIEVRA